MALSFAEYIADEEQIPGYTDLTFKLQYSWTDPQKRVIQDAVRKAGAHDLADRLFGGEVTISEMGYANELLHQQLRPLQRRDLNAEETRRAETLYDAIDMISGEHNEATTGRLGIISSRPVVRRWTVEGDEWTEDKKQLVRDVLMSKGETTLADNIFADGISADDADRVHNLLTEEDNEAQSRMYSSDQAFAYAEAVNEVNMMMIGERDYFASLDRGMNKPSHLPSFGDAPVRDAKIKTPKAKAASSSMQELKDSLPPGVSPGQSGYADRYR